jgi:hypothetical protein
LGVEDDEVLLGVAVAQDLPGVVVRVEFDPGVGDAAAVNARDDARTPCGPDRELVGRCGVEVVVALVGEEEGAVVGCVDLGLAPGGETEVARSRVVVAPGTVALCPLATLFQPPPTVESSPAASLIWPPLTVPAYPLAVLSLPPPMVE